MTYKEFCESIGLNIKFYRQHLHYTQSAMSEKIGMDVRYLSDIERGNKNITLKTLYKIANVLNVKPMDLFVFPQNKNRKNNKNSQNFC